VSNGERHSLARIPLRWMIKECFDVKTGIIFDAHMLKHQVGLVLHPGTTHEAQPPYPLPDDPTESDNGFSLRRMLTSPFSWIKSKFSQTSPSESVSDRKKPASKDKFIFKGGFQEELNDALSPICDQLEKYWYWKVMEWIPCGLPPSPERFGLMTSLKGSLGRNAPSWMTQMTPGATGSCMSPHFCGLSPMSLTMFAVSWNRGKGRVVYRQVMRRGMNVHRSVKIRMLGRGLDRANNLYVPEIRFPVDGEVRRLTREEWLAQEPECFEWAD
jgi:hypothetical protein